MGSEMCIRDSTNTDEPSITSWFKAACRSAKLSITLNFPELNFSTKLINQSVVCRSTSYGAGLFNPITFFTPLVSQSSCLIIAITISEIRSVAIAK